ncbi:hypothetical protein MA16_Dca020026 [Dendrobium catenatum]|uniref:Uncharacterized protein n=1 Tax=Dendrobium catenatum TaxID=906689 RepID=A0A2I0VYM9_9ASPA|nr:hypothetical protein MA16_Dca020026 [Dendrobium catenatum]
MMEEGRWHSPTVISFVNPQVSSKDFSSSLWNGGIKNNMLIPDEKVRLKNYSLVIREGFHPPIQQNALVEGKGKMIAEDSKVSKDNSRMKIHNPKMNDFEASSLVLNLKSVMIEEVRKVVVIVEKASKFMDDVELYFDGNLDANVVKTAESRMSDRLESQTDILLLILKKENRQFALLISCRLSTLQFVGDSTNWYRLDRTEKLLERVKLDFAGRRPLAMWTGDVVCGDAMGAGVVDLKLGEINANNMNKVNNKSHYGDKHSSALCTEILVKSPLKVVSAEKDCSEKNPPMQIASTIEEGEIVEPQSNVADQNPIPDAKELKREEHSYRRNSKRDLLKKIRGFERKEKVSLSMREECEGNHTIAPGKLHAFSYCVLEFSVFAHIVLDDQNISLDDQLKIKTLIRASWLWQSSLSTSSWMIFIFSLTFTSSPSLSIYTMSSSSKCGHLVVGSSSSSRRHNAHFLSAENEDAYHKYKACKITSPKMLNQATLNFEVLNLALRFHHFPVPSHTGFPLQLQTPIGISS